MLSKSDLARIQEDLVTFDRAREKILENSRTATRLSDWAIVQCHRRQLAKATETLAQAKRALRDIEKILGERPELRHAGNVLIAYQEYAEARLLLSYVSSGKLPSLREVETEPVPYILGLLDFTGEIRRMALDALRRGKASEAEKKLALMESIYEDLLSLDRTAIIPTFRRKMDVIRKVIEATRGDVVTDLRRMSLEKAIKGLEERVR